MSEKSPFERGAVADYRELQPSDTQKRKPSKQLQKRLPEVTTMQGFKVRLTDKDLGNIERLVSLGATVDYVAFTLGITAREFDLAVNNSLRVEEAVRNGMAMDEHEMLSAAREKGKEGHFQYWAAYMRQKHGYVDNRGDKGQGHGSVSIVLNTGIDRGEPVSVERVE